MRSRTRADDLRLNTSSCWRLELFSRRVVGWELHERLERTLALEAVHMALAQRQPAQGLLHHSDRGSQYASREYQQLLAQYGFRGSMSSQGKLLGQRGGGKLLRHVQARTGLPESVAHPSSGSQ